jgi:RNA-directed DNA polymerase
VTSRRASTKSPTRSCWGRVRRRIADRRVVALVKAFLKSGVLSEDGIRRDTTTGTPQGGILSPLLANIALTVLDEHFAEAWQATMASRVDRARRRRHGQATYRLVRYPDDFVVLVCGGRHHVEALKTQAAQVLAGVGLRLSAEKTTIAHIDEGFEFLGFRIQRQTKRGTRKRFVYTWPSKRALTSITAKVKTITRQGTNNPCPTCCASSTRCCAAGRTTSGTASPRTPSPTCSTTPGGG